MTFTTGCVIGLGTMGGPIAGALATALTVTGVDADPGKQEAARAAGLLVPDSEVPWADCELVIISLGDPRISLDVCRRIADAPGQVRLVIDTSTVGPDTSRACHALLSGITDFMDAPVLGRPGTCGSWTLPVGATDEPADDVVAVLSTIATTIQRVGPVGAGSAVKVLNNSMFAVMNSAIAQTLDLAAAVGVDPGVYHRLLVDSGAATVSPLFREVGRAIVEDDFTPSFTVDLLAKDNDLAIAMADQAGRSLPLNREVARHLRAARDLDLGALDTAAVTKVFEDPA